MSNMQGTSIKYGEKYPSNMTNIYIYYKYALHIYFGKCARNHHNVGHSTGILIRQAFRKQVIYNL